LGIAYTFVNVMLVNFNTSQRLPLYQGQLTKNWVAAIYRSCAGDSLQEFSPNDSSFHPASLGFFLVH